MSRIDDRKDMSEATRLTLLERDADTAENRDERMQEALAKLNTRITVMIVTFAVAAVTFALNLTGGYLGGH